MRSLYCKLQLVIWMLSEVIESTRRIVHHLYLRTVDDLLITFKSEAKVYKVRDLIQKERAYREQD